MNTADIAGAAIPAALGLLIIAMAIALLKGRGSFLIAGFNTMPKSEKEKYDVEALCKFTGKILLPIGILLLFMPLGIYIDLPWFSFAFPVIVLGLVLFAAIYANTGNRFKK